MATASEPADGRSRRGPGRWALALVLALGLAAADPFARFGPERAAPFGSNGSGGWGGAAMAQQSLQETPDPAGFADWVRRFRAEALAAGVRADIFDQAFAGVTLNPRVVELDQSQPEFTTNIWDYLGRAVSDTRVANGRRHLVDHQSSLAAIEARYGVPSEVVVAIWGLESNFGGFRGDFALIRSLATLAYNRRRQRFWKEQIIAALKILQNGDTTLTLLKGSWAGAMGHTQFMPTSYQAYAVDFDGDGRRDIWSEDPVDALASTANYLAEYNWRRGEPWGFHVALPDGFDYSLAESGKRSTADWAALGLRLASGEPLPPIYEDAELLLPAGAQGPAFLTLNNFRSILRYNTATSYALAVSLLSERISGRPPRSLDWPTSLRALSRDERFELQESLTALGYDTQGVDGMLGPNSRSAIRRFQAARGLTPDGYPSDALLGEVRRARGGQAPAAQPVADQAADDPERAAETSADADAATALGDLREIQAFLMALGYETGGVDGVIGSRTRRAMAAFIRDRRLSIPAEPSPALLAALRVAVRGE